MSKFAPYIGAILTAVAVFVIMHFLVDFLKRTKNIGERYCGSAELGGGFMIYDKQNPLASEVNI